MVMAQLFEPIQVVPFHPCFSNALVFQTIDSKIGCGKHLIQRRVRTHAACVPRK